jgi:hypothetical protein
MSRLEKFTLATVIIGLVADVLALGIFLIQVLSLSQTESLSVSPIVIVITLLVLFYSWIMLAWFIARAYAVQNGKIVSSLSTFGKAIFGLCVFFVPFFSVWGSIFFPTGSIFMEDFFGLLVAGSLGLPILGLILTAPMASLLQVVYPKLFSDPFS